MFVYCWTCVHQTWRALAGQMTSTVPCRVSASTMAPTVLPLPQGQMFIVHGRVSAHATLRFW